MSRETAEKQKWGPRQSAHNMEVARPSEGFGRQSPAVPIHGCGAVKATEQCCLCLVCGSHMRSYASGVGLGGLLVLSPLPSGPHVHARWPHLLPCSTEGFPGRIFMGEEIGRQL